MSDESKLEQARAVVAAEIRRRMQSSESPLLVALDGPSGAGKTTLATALAADFQTAHVPSDDFYAADIPDARWDALSPAGRAEHAIDWRRLRRDALEPLLAGRPARWHPFDFLGGTRPDGTYGMQTRGVELPPASIIVLEGAYSTRPQLEDLISLTVLVDAPRELCHARLAAREQPSFLAAWHERWDAAEDYYFTQVRPRSSFDRIVSI